MRPGVVLAGAVIVLSGAVAASAYVRSRTEKTRVPVFWDSTCAWLVPDLAGPTDVPFAAALAALDRSIANWQSSTRDAGCSYLSLIRQDPVPLETRLDGINVVKFRSDRWCRPAEDKRAETCYDRSATAITTVFYTNDPGQPDDGAILDADIQLNEVNFELTTTDPDGPPGENVADLENTLTHELGHFQGLDHTCWDHSPPNELTAPTDENGVPIPDCADVEDGHLPFTVSAPIRNSTMYFNAQRGEITKRSIENQDRRAICDIYPIAAAAPDAGAAPQCARPVLPQTGCSLSRSPIAAGPAGALWVALALLALAARPRPAPAVTGRC